MRKSKLKIILKGGFKKQFNLLLLLVSYYLKLPKPLGRPAFLMVEPTNFCNLSCKGCPVGLNEIKKSKGSMDYKKFAKLINEIGDYVFWINLWNWGEPFLNKDIGKIIKFAREKKVYVSTSTNGHFLEEYVDDILSSDLNELIIAVDGLSQETLEKYRKGADFEKIVKGIKALSKEKKKRKLKNPVITLQFIVMKHNQHELTKIKEFAKNVGIDKAVIKTFGSHLDFGKLKEFEPDNKDFSRYSNKKKSKLCRFAWFDMVINYDGNIVPCCYDPFEKHVFGNVFQENSALNVWNNNNFVDFRKRLKNRENIDICVNCEFNKNISKEIDIK